MSAESLLNERKPENIIDKVLSMGSEI